MESKRIDAEELLKAIGADNQEQQEMIDSLISDLDQGVPEQS